MSRASDIAGRAYNRVSADFGAANVERVILYGAVIGVGYMLYQAWKVKNAIGVGLDSATKKAADIYVAATAGPPIQIADGIVYILPNGAKIAANTTTPVGGGKFVYLGKTYKAYEASPPGSGYYKVKPA